VHYLLRALKNGQEVILDFESLRSAKRFKEFCNIFMGKCRGNGYGSYWVYYDGEVNEVDAIPDIVKVERKVDENFLNNMAADITRKITNDPSAPNKIRFNYIGTGDNQDCIAFDFSPLPTRKEI
jgi:hypothetical protein